MSVRIWGQDVMSRSPVFGKTFIAATLGLCLSLLLASSVRAADMPHAAGSPIAGITFDDRPLMLPVQRNFQMAMLTASSEMGRSCGKMEAYGWRMAPNEQQRVNQLFNNTVDRMRAQGFMVESKAPSSVSRDVTMFTADRPEKHLIFMWSAGEIGLVMVLCETSAPLAPTPRAATMPSINAPPPARGLHEPPPPPSAGHTLEAPLPLTRTGKRTVENFSPVGDWVGTYTCQQGTTGGTLQISRVRGDQFEGQFRFYPTPKNPYVPTGRYMVSGEYDRDSYRVLVNPGKWLERPKNFYNTIMIGSFDPVAKTFSGYFQGINGCTSFEARHSSASNLIEDGAPGKAKKPVKKAVKKKVKKAPAKKAKPTEEKAKEEVKPESSAESPKPATDSPGKVTLPPKPDASPASASETPGIRLLDHPAPPKQ